MAEGIGRMNRRGALVGGAAMAAGLVGGGVAFAGSPGAKLPPGGPDAGNRSGVSPKVAKSGVAPAVVAALPALAPGGQSYLVFGADLTASASIAGASVVYVASLQGSYVSPGWLGLSVEVPVGSLITGADCIVNGNPRSGSEAAYCDHHDPVGAGFIGTVGEMGFTAGSGVELQTMAINLRYTGSEVYEIYFSNLSAASVVRGIRVRYIPPTSGLVPIATTRVYDSGTASVGTTPVAVTVAGAHGIPANATAVVVNTEVFAPSAAGYVRVTPYGSDPQVAVQEFTAGQTISNLVIVKLNAGKIQVKVSAGHARILMDVSGYYTA